MDDCTSLSSIPHRAVPLEALYYNDQIWMSKLLISDLFQSVHYKSAFGKQTSNHLTPHFHPSKGLGIEVWHLLWVKCERNHFWN